MMSSRRAALKRWVGGLAAASLGVARFARAAEGDWVVGQIGPFTGIPVPDATQLNQGMKAYFAQLNARGGIKSRKLSFFELDDSYTGEGFVKAFAEAMRRKPVALLSPVGSVAIKRMLDDKLLDSADVVVLNAVPGAESLRSPGHPRLFHIRAGDKQQIEKIVRHARTLGISKMAVLHQDIPIGMSGLAVAKQTAAQAGGITISEFKATVDEATIAAAVANIANAAAPSVLVVGAPKFMADGVAHLRKATRSQFVFALSYVPAGLLYKTVGAGARGVALAQTYPNPNGTALPLSRDFQAAMKATQPKMPLFTSFHLEGYVTARVFTEAARRATEPGPEGLARSLRAMGEIDLGGFRVNFARDNVGSSFVDIGVVTEDGRLLY